MEHILEVDNLCKAYPDTTFMLNNVSFNVCKGTIVGLVGKNGAGKSTTIKSILNIINRDSGNVKLFGKDTKDDITNELNNIAVVFDAINFNKELTPKKLEKVLSDIYINWDKQIYYNFLNRFQIPCDKKIESFSRGMTMKLSISVCLSHKANLLILDEATSGLDPVVRDEILDIFLDYIQNEDCSILIASHITSDLEKVADYITFVNNGKIIFSENKDELIYNSGVVKCSEKDIDKISKEDIVGIRKNTFGCEVMVSDRAKYENIGFVIDKTNLEEIILFKVRGQK